MSEGDAIGGFVTGSLIARELSGTGARHAAHSGQKHATCLNCGTPTPGHYCPECGQHAHVARSIGHILHELVHGILHLDGKVWRTLPMLIAKPGLLTRDYVEGRRARYVAPFGIFLFTVFAMYFTFAFVGAPGGIMPSVPAGGAEEAAAEMRTELNAVNERLAGLYEERVAARAAGDEAALARIDGDIADAEFEKRITERAYNSALTGNFDWQGQMDDITGQIVAQQRAAETGAGQPDSTNINTGVDWLDDKLQHITGNPELYFYKIKQSAYKYSFLLLPISLPFVWLLFFWRRDLHLYDHTVFILYSLSFMSLLTILLWVGMAAGIWGWAVFWSALTFIPPVHMYKQLKYAYRLGRAGALARTVVLCAFAIAALTIFAMIVAALGAL